MSDIPQRHEIHRRQIDLRFFRRDDGLYEVEGTLVDTKTHDFQRPLGRGPIPAGDPVHDMTLRLVVDGSLQVIDAVAFMRTTPFEVCQGAASTLAPLKGLKIGAGWNSAIRKLLPQDDTCTHLRELLGPMATTALQGTAVERVQRMRQPGHEDEHRAKVDSCYAYAAHRPVVAKLWPHLSRSKPGSA